MNHEFWYLSRAAGFTAYLLLFVSVALGISIGTRLTERFARRNTIFDLHRFTALLALAFTAFHVLILLGDQYFSFNIWQLTVPFLSPYRTWQTAVGVLSLYVLAIIVVSFYVRKYIGYRAWRVIHFLTFALFAGAALHGLAAGTDTTQPWAKAIYLSTGTATLALVMYRIQYRMPDDSTARALRLGSATATVVTAAVLLFGTGLLTAQNHTRTAAADVNAASAPQQANPAPQPTPQPYPFLPSFDNDFSGTYTQTQDATSSQLVLDGTTTGDLTAKIHVELQSKLAVPTPDSETNEHEANDNETTEAQPGSSITVNKAEVLDGTTDAVLCEGQLTALDQGYLRMTCDGTGPYQGVRISISSRVRAQADGSFSGALSGNMQRVS